MADFFGIDIKGIVHDALTGQVQQGTLIRSIQRPSDPERRDAPLLAESRHAFEGFVGSARQDTFRTGAAMTQRMVTILGGSIDVEPQSNDQLEIEGKTYSVSRVVHDFTEAVYECYVG